MIDWLNLLMRFLFTIRTPHPLFAPQTEAQKSCTIKIYKSPLIYTSRVFDYFIWQNQVASQMCMFYQLQIFLSVVFK